MSRTESKALQRIFAQLVKAVDEEEALPYKASGLGGLRSQKSTFKDFCAFVDEAFTVDQVIDESDEVEDLRGDESYEPDDEEEDETLEYEEECEEDEYDESEEVSPKDKRYLA